MISRSWFFKRRLTSFPLSFSSVFSASVHWSSNGHGNGHPRPWISFSSCEIKVCKLRSLGEKLDSWRWPWHGPLGWAQMAWASAYSWGLGILWISMDFYGFLWMLLDVWMYFEWLFSDLWLIKTGWFIKSQPHQATCATLKFVTPSWDELPISCHVTYEAHITWWPWHICMVTWGSSTLGGSKLEP